MNGTVPILSMIFMVISCIIGFALPLVMFLYLRLKKKADLLPFFIGCAVMLLFALVLEALVHQAVLGSGIGAAIQQNVWLYGLYGGLMAGLFEETGRYLAFRTVLKKYQHRDVNALMYGAGHGGFEAAVLLGVTMINNLIYSIMINTGGAPTLLASVPDGQKAQMQGIIQALAATKPHEFLLGGVERIFAMALQISLSVLVWFAAKRRDKRWLFPAAIGLHTAMDAIAAILAGLGTNVLLIEAIVCLTVVLSAVIARWIWQANAATEATDAN